MPDKLHILAVERDQSDIDILRTYLGTNPDFSLEFCESFADCRNILSRKTIDVVLLNLDLPDSQGLGTLQKYLSSFSKTPVVILARRADETLAFEAVRAGAQDCVNKEDVTQPLLEKTIRYAVERHRAHSDSRSTHDLTKRILESISEGLFVLDHEFVVTYMNPAAEMILHRKREDVIGRYIFKAFPETKHTVFHEQFTQMLNDKTPKAFEAYFDAEPFYNWYRVRVYPHEDGYSFFFTIITEQKKTEEKLKLMSSAVEQSREGIAICDLEAKLVYVNDAFAKMHGYTTDELFGRRISVLHSDKQMLAVKAANKKILEEGKFAGELWHTRKDGTVFPTLIQISTLREESGELIGVIATAHDISDRKGVEETLRESEAKFRNIFENSPMGVFVFELDSEDHLVVKDTNTAADKLLNMDTKILIGSSIEGAFPALTGTEALERYYNAAKHGQSWHSEQFEYTDDKIKGIFEVHAFQTRPGEMAVKFLDVTERKQSEKALQESEKRLELALNGANLGLWDWNLQTGKAVWSQKTSNALGYARNEIKPDLKTWKRLVHPDDWESVAQSFNDHMKGLKPLHEVQYRMKAKNGAWKWVFSRGMVVEHDDQGKPLRMTGTTLDITELKNAEEALKQSEERYRTLFQDATNGILIVKPEGEILDANPALAQLLGLPRSELIGLPIQQFYWDPADRSKFRQEMHTVGFIKDFNWIVKRKDGTKRHCLVNSSVWRDKNDQLIGYLSIVRDVTEEKQGEEERVRLVTAVEQAAESIVVTDTDGIIQYVNPAFERITGYSAQEAIGQKTEILKSGEHDQAFYEAMWGILKNGGVWSGRIINKAKDGKIFEEEATISPIKDAAGNIINYVGVKKNVTDEVKLKKQLVQAQRMESIATMAGGIAHDFNNLLTIASGYAELMLADKHEDDPGYEELQTILHATSRGADLVKRILTFSRKVDISMRPINLNDEIRNAQKLLYKTIPKMIDIEMKLADDLKQISADPGQMEQIILNLAVNAQHAMPDGGKLMFETQNVYLDGEYCKHYVDAKQGAHVVLQVSDTGVGMSKEIVERVFEPFYTTKKSGEGTGLGLAMVFGIVKSHGGHITCYSEIGMGTTFKIYFPIIDPSETSSVEESSFFPSFGMETVLLVDDEQPIRDLGKRILERGGYTVLTGSNGKEAIDIYKRDQKHISLVILDMIMPEMGGKQCIEELLQYDPGAKVLVASGFGLDPESKEHIKSWTQGFVSKPYRHRELLKQVRQVLDSSR